MNKKIAARKSTPTNDVKIVNVVATGQLKLVVVEWRHHNTKKVLQQQLDLPYIVRHS